MNEQMQTWAAPALAQQELMEELEIAQAGGANLLNSVYAGTLVRALADCKRCEGGCRLWYMDDTEAPADVCPYFCLAQHQERFAC
jgi:hypothetical protein